MLSKVLLRLIRPVAGSVILHLYKVLSLELLGYADVVFDILEDNIVVLIRIYRAPFFFLEPHRPFVPVNDYTMKHLRRLLPIFVLKARRVIPVRAVKIGCNPFLCKGAAVGPYFIGETL